MIRINNINLLVLIMTNIYNIIILYHIIIINIKLIIITYTLNYL